MVSSDLKLAAGTRLRFNWSDGGGLEVEKTLTFRDGDYLVGHKFDVIDRGRRLPVRTVWGPGFAAHAPGGGGSSRMSYYNYNNKILWNVGGQVSRENGRKVDDRMEAGKLIWGGLGDQYFAALMIPTTGKGSVRMWPQEVDACPWKGQEEEDDDEVEIVPGLAVSTPEEGFSAVHRPQEVRHAEAARVPAGEIGLVLQLPAAVPDFQIPVPRNRWIQKHTLPNYGLAIILATFCLRLVLFPLNQFSMVRMRKTQVDMAAAAAEDQRHQEPVQEAEGCRRPGQDEPGDDGAGTRRKGSTRWAGWSAVFRC